MNFILKNGFTVNEHQIRQQDILIENERIVKIDRDISIAHATVVDLNGKYVFPGIIDDQVHFREPGLTHKASIFSESRAAVAGGVTSFMEQPNTKPAALTQALLEEKYRIAANTSWCNYTFFMGVSNDNYDEVMCTNPENVGAIKIFMGSSTGNMLVDDEHVLSKIFANSPSIIVTHCEDEKTITANTEKCKALYGEHIPMNLHPIIRNDEACYISSKHAVELAQKHGSRLHIFHISTEKELSLFDNSIPLKNKKITAEVCVHHLYFDERDYARLGSQLKCNPAVKYEHDKHALLKAVLDDRLDVIATDHAPHTWTEKQQPYFNSPSGVPLVQHSINVLLEFYHQKKISLEKIVEKMCHAPADCFRIKERGYLHEGYYADIAVIDIEKKWTVGKDNIYFQCGWSPFEQHNFLGKVEHTFVNGSLVYDRGNFSNHGRGMRLRFGID